MYECSWQLCVSAWLRCTKCSCCLQKTLPYKRSCKPLSNAFWKVCGIFSKACLFPVGSWEYMSCIATDEKEVMSMMEMVNEHLQQAVGELSQWEKGERALQLLRLLYPIVQFV